MKKLIKKLFSLENSLGVKYNKEKQRYEKSI